MPGMTLNAVLPTSTEVISRLLGAKALLPSSSGAISAAPMATAWAIGLSALCW